MIFWNGKQHCMIWIWKEFMEQRTESVLLNVYIQKGILHRIDRLTGGRRNVRKPENYIKEVSDGK